MTSFWHQDFLSFNAHFDYSLDSYQNSIVMGINSHRAVAIAQTVAYIPIVPLAIFITIRNRSHPPALAWYPFILFSMSQGSLTIQLVRSADTNNCYSASRRRSSGSRARKRYHKYRFDHCCVDPPERRLDSPACHNSGYHSTNVRKIGGVKMFRRPCLANQFHCSLDEIPQIQRSPERPTKAARSAFIVAATLLSAGAGLAQHPQGRILTVAGYAVLAAILVAMILIQLFLWRDSSTLIPYTRKVNSRLAAT